MHTNHFCWQAVFFDFDGVIAASTEVKIQAFTTLFASYGPTVQDAVIRYHLANGGLPRREKLRHCLEIIAGQATNDHQLDRMGQAFADLVVDKVVAAPLIAGALPTLQQLHASSVPAFVVSGTPEDEMQLIVARKGLQSLFTGVSGSPRPKTEIIRDILGRFSFAPDQCLFIGDALADYRAAQETGLHFLGIVPDGQPSIFPEKVITSSTVTLKYPKKDNSLPLT